MKKIIIIFLLFLSIKSYSQWTQIPTPTNEYLTDIYFTNENIGYCIGLNGIILKTNDGGDTWNNISFNSQNLKQMYFLNSQTGIIISDNNIYKTTNGIDFIDISFNFNINNYNQRIVNISFKDNFGFIKVQYTNSNDASDVLHKTYKTYDFGNSWQELDSFDFTEDGFYYIIDVNTYYFVWSDLKKTDDGGANWVTIPNITFGFPPFQKSFKIFSNNLGLATLEYNYDYLTLDLNNNSITSYTSNAHYSYDCIDNNVYFLRNGIFYNSDDYGVTINEIDNSNVEMFSYNIFMVNTDIGFACGENGAILKITNASQLNVNNETLEKKIKIYPIPAKNSIKIEFTGIKIKKIELININGKLIKTFNSNFTELKICTISKGSYILKIETENGVLNKKILIE